MDHNSIHVGFDCDGVLRNLRSKIISSFVEKYPEHRKIMRDPHETDDWDLRTALRFYDEDVYQQLMDHAFNDPKSSYDVFRNADPYPEVSEYSRYFKMLERAGMIVSICTQQSDVWRRIATVQWLHVNNIEYHNIIITGKNTKQVFSLDYLIDDHARNVIDVDGSGGTGVMMERAWNKKESNRVKHSVSSINQFVKFVLDQEL